MLNAHWRLFLLRDKADKPWLFFAACHEWKRYREAGPGFRSHLPISMDGS